MSTAGLSKSKVARGEVPRSAFAWGHPRDPLPGATESRLNSTVAVDVSREETYKVLAPLLLNGRAGRRPEGTLRMFRSTRIFASFALLAALAFAAPSARAGSSAEEFIQTRQAQVTTLLRQAPTGQRDKQVAS